MVSFERVTNKGEGTWDNKRRIIVYLRLPLPFFFLFCGNFFPSFASLRFGGS